MSVNSSEQEECLERFLAYKPLLFGLAYRMLGTVCDAEDIVQDTLVAAMS
ncbi:sigma factor [Paenibacillus tarimensis]